MDARLKKVYYKVMIGIMNFLSNSRISYSIGLGLSLVFYISAIFLLRNTLQELQEVDNKVVVIICIIWSLLSILLSLPIQRYFEKRCQIFQLKLKTLNQ
jgi:hypothetical protein